MPLPEGRKPLGNEWFMKNVTPLPEVTRVELIDDTGRAYSQWNVKDVELHLQDNKRTLKIFLKGETNE